jgi:hypothetical protein
MICDSVSYTTEKAALENIVLSENMQYPNIQARNFILSHNLKSYTISVWREDTTQRNTVSKLTLMEHSTGLAS